MIKEKLYVWCCIPDGATGQGEGRLSMDRMQLGLQWNNYNHWKLHSATSLCLPCSLKQKWLLLSNVSYFSPLIIPSQNVLAFFLELLRSLELNSSGLEQYFPKCEMLQIMLDDAQVWQIKLNHVVRKLFPFQFFFHPSDDTKDKDTSLSLSFSLSLSNKHRLESQSLWPAMVCSHILITLVIFYLFSYLLSS